MEKKIRSSYFNFRSCVCQHYPSMKDDYEEYEDAFLEDSCTIDVLVAFEYALKLYNDDREKCSSMKGIPYISKTKESMKKNKEENKERKQRTIELCKKRRLDAEKTRLEHKIISTAVEILSFQQEEKKWPGLNEQFKEDKEFERNFNETLCLDDPIEKEFEKKLNLQEEDEEEFILV